MNKKVLFFAVVLSVTFMAMNTESFSAETQAAPAPAKVAMTAPAQAATPAAIPAQVVVPAQVATPVAPNAPAKVVAPVTNTNVNYGTAASTNRASRPRVGLGFDGIPFNGSHREATRIRRSYRGR